MHTHTINGREVSKETDRRVSKPAEACHVSAAVTAGCDGAASGGDDARARQHQISRVCASMRESIQ